MKFAWSLANYFGTCTALIEITHVTKEYLTDLTSSVDDKCNIIARFKHNKYLEEIFFFIHSSNH